MPCGDIMKVIANQAPNIHNIQHGPLGNDENKPLCFGQRYWFQSIGESKERQKRKRPILVFMALGGISPLYHQIIQGIAMYSIY